MSLRWELQGGHQPTTGVDGGRWGITNRDRGECAVHAGGQVCVSVAVRDGNFKDGIMATPASDAKGSKLLIA